MPAFSGSIKFDNGTNYTYFTIRDDQYVYSIEVAYKANEVKRSYHDIRNMVEMARLISRQNKQEFPVLKHLWKLMFLNCLKSLINMLSICLGTLMSKKK